MPVVPLVRSAQEIAIPGYGVGVVSIHATTSKISKAMLDILS